MTVLWTNVETGQLCTLTQIAAYQKHKKALGDPKITTINYEFCPCGMGTTTAQVQVCKDLPPPDFRFFETNNPMKIDKPESLTDQEWKEFLEKLYAPTHLLLKDLL